MLTGFTISKNIQEVIDFLEGKGTLKPTVIDTRAEFYKTVKYKKNKTFEYWLEDMWKKAMDSEEYSKANMIKAELKKLGIHVGPEEEVEPNDKYMNI